jgi:hypothetical protein
MSPISPVLHVYVFFLFFFSWSMRRTYTGVHVGVIILIYHAPLADPGILGKSTTRNPSVTVLPLRHFLIPFVMVKRNVSFMVGSWKSSLGWEALGVLEFKW